MRLSFASFFKKQDRKIPIPFYRLKRKTLFDTQKIHRSYIGPCRIHLQSVYEKSEV